MFGGNYSLQSTICFVEHPRSRDAGDMALDGIPFIRVDRSTLFFRGRAEPDFWLDTYIRRA